MKDDKFRAQKRSSEYQICAARFDCECGFRINVGKDALLLRFFLCLFLQTVFERF